MAECGVTVPVGTAYLTILFQGDDDFLSAGVDMMDGGPGRQAMVAV